MNGLTTMLTHGWLLWMERIGWAVVHSLWQLTLLALGAVLVTKWVSRESVVQRYRIQCLAMMLMLVVPIATVLLVEPEGRPLQVNPDSISGAQSVLLSSTTDAEGSLPPDMIPEFQNGDPDSDSAALTSATNEEAGASSAQELARAHAEQPEWSVATVIPWLSVLWLGGFAALSLWQLAGWLWLTRTVRRLDSRRLKKLEQLAAEFAQRLGLKRAIRVAETGLVRAPAVAGFWRPVILMPVEVVTGLPLEQMSAVLAHELAHIHRRDALINALQTVTETILFYHPAVWWMSRRIRIDREHCADDMVIELTGDRLQYARALTAVAEISQRIPGTLVAANGGDLKARITRILQGKSTPRNSVPWGWLPLAVVLLVATLVQTVSYSSLANEADNRVAETKNSAEESPAEDGRVPSDTPAGAVDSKKPGGSAPRVIRLGKSNWRHALPLELAAWSANDKYIATAEQDGDIRVWDRKTGRDLFLAETGRRQSAYGMAFSPDGRQLAFVDTYGVAWGFSVPDGKQTFRTVIPKVVEGKPLEPVNSGGLDWSPDGSTIAVKAGGSLALLNPEDGSIRVRRISRAGIRHGPVAYSIDGKYIAVAEQRIVQVYSAAMETVARCAEEKIKGAHADSVVAIAWAKAGGKQVLVTGGRGAVRSIRIGNTFGSAVDEVRSWDPETGEMLNTFETEGFNNGVFGIRAIGPEFTQVAVMTNVEVRIHNADTGHQVRTINQSFNTKGDMFQNCLAISPDGSQLVAPAHGNQLGFWRIATGNQIDGGVPPIDPRIKPRLNPEAKLELGVHSGPVRFLSASRDGKVVASGSKDGLIAVWDSEGAFVMHQLVMRDRNQSAGLSSLALSPDGRYLAAGVGHRISKGRDNIIGEGTIRLWELVKGQGGVPIKAVQVDFVPGLMDFSRSGQVLAVGSDNRFNLFYSFRKELKPPAGKLREKIYLFQTDNFDEEFRAVPGHSGQLAMLKFKADDDLVTAATDGSLQFWNLTAWLADEPSESNERKIGIPPHTTRAAIDQSTTWVATNTYFGEHVDLISLKGRAKRQIPIGNAKGAELALSPDGRLLATAGQMLTSTTGRFDERVHIWQTGTGKNVLTQNAIDGAATSLMFSGDGSKLLAGTSRGTVLVISTADLAKEAPVPSGQAEAANAVEVEAPSPDRPAAEPVRTDPPSVKKAAEKSAAAKKKPKLTREEAARRAIAFLKKQQKASGSWSSQADREDGQTPLTGYALLKAGVPSDDPAIQKCADYLAQRRSNMTYHVGFEILFWLEVNDDRGRAIVRRYIEMLEKGQNQEGPAVGQWRYIAGKASGDGDASNTGIALWALIEAARAGMEVNPEVFERSMEFLLKQQTEDGGWGYIQNVRATGGMTCSSLDSLLGCADVLARKDDEEFKQARERALDWIDKHYEEQILQAGGWRYYGFMHLGRIGREEKMQTHGKSNPFRDAWNHLANAQRADGSWLSQAGPQLTAATTAFPLIFLGMIDDDDSKTNGAGD